MFNSAAYTSVVPAGTSKAILICSDGESNASANGQHPSSQYTDAQLNTLAQTTAAAAWAQGISVYVVFYYHGSDTDADTALLQSLVQGNGTFTMTTNASTLPTGARCPFQGHHGGLRRGTVSRTLWSAPCAEMMRNLMLMAVVAGLLGGLIAQAAVLRESWATMPGFACQTTLTRPAPPPPPHLVPKQVAGAVPSRVAERLPGARRPLLRGGPRGCSRVASAKTLAPCLSEHGSFTALRSRTFTPHRWKSPACARAAVA